MVTASQFYHLLPLYFSVFWLLWHGSAEHEVSGGQLISPSKFFSPSGVMNCLRDFNHKQPLPSWNSFLHLPDPVFSWTSAFFFQRPCAFSSSVGRGGALELDFPGSQPSSSTSYLCSVGQDLVEPLFPCLINRSGIGSCPFGWWENLMAW